MSQSETQPTAPVPSRRAPHRFWLDLVLVALLGGGFFLLALGGRPYANPDEGRYASIAAEMLDSGDWQTPRVNGVQYLEKPPLFYWLEAVSAEAFGVTPFGLRLAPLLVATFGLCATYAAGRALFDRGTALWGAGLLGAAFLYYVTSRFLSLDLTLGVFLATGLFAFIAGIDMKDGWPRRLLLWSLYVFAALAVLTKGLVAVVLIGLTVLLWLIATWRWRLLARAELPVGIGLFLLIAVPWHVAMTIDHPAFFDFYFIREHFERFLTRGHHRYQPAWFFLAVLAVGALPWTALLPAAWRDLGGWWRQRRAPVAVDGAGSGSLFLAIAVLVILVFFSLSSSKLIPYILPLFPPLALLAARPVARFARGIAVPWLRGGLWATAIAFVAAGIVAPLLALLGLLAIAPHFLRLQVRQMADGGIAVWLAGLSLLLGGALAVWLLRQSAAGVGPGSRVAGRWLPANARILLALGLFWLPILVAANFIAGGIDARSTKAIAGLVLEVEQPGDRVGGLPQLFRGPAGLAAPPGDRGRL